MSEEAQTKTPPSTRSVNVSIEVYNQLATIAANQDRAINKQLERILKKAFDQGITD